MKVTITKEARRWITLEEAPVARKIIEDMKEDAAAKEYAKSAVNCIGSANGRGFNWCSNILEATAEISGNRRVWNAYSDESGRLDIWINFTARTGTGFVEGGAYLTDIWQIDGTNYGDLSSHMYYRIFEEVKVT